MKKELEVSRDAVKKAGDLILSKFNIRHNVRIKSDNTELLDEDLESEKILVHTIETNFPGDSIFTEESAREIKGNRVWAFDPICGSYSYLRGVETWSISMALFIDNIARLGVVYQPLFGNLYWGVKGEGAWLNGNPVAPAENTDIGSLFVSVEHAVFNSGKVRILDLIKNIKRIRVGHGSGGELAYVASGKLDVVIKTDQTLMHFAGGRAVIEAAGGKFLDFSGIDAPVYFDKNKKIDYVACASMDAYKAVKPFLNPETLV